MTEQTENHATLNNNQQEQADVVLARFLATSPGARLAAASLKEGAEVGVTFTNIDGYWRIVASKSGDAVFEAQKAQDPDFELRIPPGAALTISQRTDADVGDLGITFFELVSSKEQDLKINVTLHSGLIKLTKRGWLGVVAKGGAKVVGWMAHKGLRGPAAIATAIGRFKK